MLIRSKRDRNEEFNRRCAVLLLTQPDWIHRRAETVSFLPEGQTRREISFDFDVPRGEEIYWNPSTKRLVTKRPKGASHVAVPLTHMRKGGMIEFGLMDADGASLPRVGKFPAGHFHLGALLHLGSELALATNKGTATEPGSPLYEGGFCLIHGLVYRRSTMRVGDSDQPFARAGLQKRDPGTAFPGRDKVRQERIEELINYLVHGEEPGDWADKAECGDAFDGPVGELMDVLRDTVYKHRRAGKHTEEKRSQSPKVEEDHQTVLALLSLLYSAADSVVLIALVPTEQAEQRTIVKTHFDSVGSSQSGAAMTGRRFSPGPLTQRVLFPGLNAGASHLELLAPPQAKLDTPVVCTCSTPQKERQTGLGHIEHEPDCPANITEISETQSRSHVTIRKYDSRPLVEVDSRMRIPTGLLWTGLAWVLFNAATAALATVILFTRADWLHKFFTADNAIAWATMVLAVWVVARFTVGRNVTTRELYRPLNRAIGAATLIASGSMLAVALVTVEDGTFEPEPSTLLLVWTHVLTGLCALGTVGLLMEAAFIVWAMIQGKRIPTRIRRRDELPEGHHSRDQAEVAAFAGAPGIHRYTDLIPEDILSQERKGAK